MPLRRTCRAYAIAILAAAIGLSQIALAPKARAQGSDSQVSINLNGFTDRRNFRANGSVSADVPSWSNCRVGDGVGGYTAAARGSASATSGRLTFFLRGGGTQNRPGENCRAAALDSVNSLAFGSFTVAGPSGVTTPVPVSFTSQFIGNTATRLSEIPISTVRTGFGIAGLSGEFSVTARRPTIPTLFPAVSSGFSYETGLRIIPSPFVSGTFVEDLFDIDARLFPIDPNLIAMNPLIADVRSESSFDFTNARVRTAFDLLLLPGDTISFSNSIGGSVRASMLFGPSASATNSGSLFLDLPEGWSIVPLIEGTTPLLTQSPLPPFDPEAGPGGPAVIPLPAAGWLLLGALAGLAGLGRRRARA